MTCEERPVFDKGENAIEHMTKNPFHQMVYYDEKSLDSALEKVKSTINEGVIN